MKRSMLILVTLSLTATCLLIMPASKAKATKESPDTVVTFTRDVAPIFYNNCTSCHRQERCPDVVDDLSGSAAGPSRFVRRSPTNDAPWHADPKHGEFSMTTTQPARHRYHCGLGGWWFETGRSEDLPEAPKYADGWRSENRTNVLHTGTIGAG